MTDGRLRRPSVLKGKGALIEGLLGAFWGAPRRCGSASVVQRPRGPGKCSEVRNPARARVIGVGGRGGLMVLGRWGAGQVDGFGEGGGGGGRWFCGIWVDGFFFKGVASCFR